MQIATDLESPVELLVFSHTVEALFVRAIGSRLTPQIRERLKAAGLDLERIRPAYLLSDYDTFMEIAAEEVFAGMPTPDAFRKIGELIVKGYQQTVIGRALFGVLRLLSARRFLDRMTHSLRSGNNYMKTRFTEVGPNRFEVWLNEAGRHPEGPQGLIAEALRAAGHRGVVVEIKHFDGHACTYRISWPVKPGISGLTPGP
jgi:uncharacterized protein (TIGR02265 family)